MSVARAWRPKREQDGPEALEEGRPRTPMAASAATLMALQQSAGNAAVTRLLRNPTPAPAATAETSPAAVPDATAGSEGEKTDPAAAPSTIEDVRAKAVGRALKNDGKFKDGRFENGDLQRLLEHYGSEWGVDVSPPPAASAAPAAAAGATEPAATEPAPAPAKGDSEARDVARFPKWFNAFQNRLIAAKQWTADHAAVSAILEAYIRAQFPNAPTNVQAFASQLGKSEGNKEAQKLIGGADTYAWCAAASSDAVVRGLHEHGYFFDNGLGKPAKMQQGAYNNWLTNKKHNKSRQINPPNSYTDPLDPGDKVSIRAAVGPKSGHVITIIEETGGKILYVSGNAGGESIRIEEASRGIPPKDYVYDKTDHKPPRGEIWTIVIEKASRLNAHKLEELRKSDPAGWKAAMAENNLVYTSPKPSGA